MNKFIFLSFAFLTAGGCTPIPLMGPHTPSHAESGGGSDGLAFLKNRKTKTEEANAPKRDFDEDKHNNRLNVIDRLRESIRENEELEAKFRATLDQANVLRSQNQDLMKGKETMETDLKSVNAQLMGLRKEVEELTTRLLESNLREAQAQKELLGLKIGKLEEKIASEFSNKAKKKEPSPPPPAEKSKESGDGQGG